MYIDAVNAYKRLIDTIEASGAILLLLVAVIFAVDVIGRYLFGITASWIVELEWYLAAIALLVSFAPTLYRDGHVRVDVIRERMNPVSKRWIDKIGHFLFLLPWCIFIVYAASRYAYNSYLIGEGSPDPGGLPFRWIIKAFLPIGFALLGIEGLRQLVTKKVKN
ncbi:MAG: TRAP transporter small permease subunit [Saprospiraceae bacterium]